VVVVAILILAIPIIWGIAILTNLLAAMSIGGILVVAAIIGFFIWLRSRVERKVADG
jgi:nitrate reductase gamma subunit